MEINIRDLIIKALISAFLSIPIYFWLIILLLFLCSVVILLFQQYRYRESDIYEVDRMSGEDFEQFLMSLFQRLGYKAEHIGKLGDYGGDLIIEKDGVKTLVQAKRSRYKIREKAVQEAIAAKENYHCDKAMVVSNNYYYYHAWKLAQNTNVTLWTGKDLIMKMDEAKKQENKK